MLQCKNCGRMGQGVSFDAHTGLVTCKYCGVQRPYTAPFAESVKDVLRKWRDEEINNRRILLIDSLLNPDEKTDAFLDGVDDLCKDLLVKDIGDYLANVCRKTIQAERGARARLEEARREVCSLLAECGSHPQDILGTVLFLRRISHFWDFYKPQLAALLELAAAHCIAVPQEERADLVAPAPRDVSKRFDENVKRRHCFNNADLECVIFGEGVETIGESAFDGCISLASVTFGSHLSEIGSSAFCSCKPLSTLKIPASVKTIGACAFRGCGLRSVEFEQPSGWVITDLNGKTRRISADELSVPERAAKYLSKTYETYAWTRKK